MIFKSSKTLELVDIPGSEKLRFECINKRKANSTGVIYVLDSTSIQKDLKDVAEYLFDLMTDASLARSRAPFLILCNKTDLPDAKKMDTIEELLEMELTTLSRTKADGLASLDGNQELRVPLVKNTNEKFTFAKCRHHPVTFAECSAISSDSPPSTPSLSPCLYEALPLPLSSHFLSLHLSSTLVVGVFSRTHTNAARALFPPGDL
ncbi:hypothetical protein Aperf_G00000041154 [Anoplocephala perfoliata]